jgi:hypothetical protein
MWENWITDPDGMVVLRDCQTAHLSGARAHGGAACTPHAVDNRGIDL